MAPRDFAWRALVPVLGMGICVAGTASIGAQDLAPRDEGLVHMKRLDLSVNPMRSTAEDAGAGAPPPPPADGFYETPIALRGLGRDAGGDQGANNDRVINGTPSKAGAWKSAVNMEIRRGYVHPDGKVTEETLSCGGAIIDSQWVLSAAHCIYDERIGGLKSVKWITVYEGSLERKRGRALAVTEIYANDQFKDIGGQLVNDLSLMKLEKPAQSPRQKLAAYRGVNDFIKPGNMATVVGWGNTDPNGYSISPVLLQANVPIVAKPACHSIYPGVGDVAFCAGYPQGGTDTCQGDSGGPLFVAGANGEPVQAGIVSFGKGCAQANAYGVYTNLGLFEGWIKKIVPTAYFTVPAGGESGSLGGIAGATPGGPPAPKGQVAVDIRQVACRDSKEPFKVYASPNRISAGSCIQVQVTSGVSGHLGVFARDASGKSMQIFPNPASGSKQVGTAPTSIKAGRTVNIPDVADGFQYRIGPPFGPDTIIAVVVPDSVGAPKAWNEKRSSMRVVPDLAGELAELNRQVILQALPKDSRAVGTRQYEVVP